MAPGTRRGTMTPGLRSGTRSGTMSGTRAMTTTTGKTIQAFAMTAGTEMKCGIWLWSLPTTSSKWTGMAIMLSNIKN